MNISSSYIHAVPEAVSKEICCICGKEHDFQECDYVFITKYIPDNEIPSRAKLTLPEFLQLEILADGTHSVITKSFIHKGTQFGPVQGEKTRTLNTLNTFPLKIFACDESKNSEYYLDIDDENKCNWLMFISHADNFEEQNLVCFQAKGEIYYVVIKDIAGATTLKVWYSPYYASKMHKPILTSPHELDPTENIDINALIKKQQNIMERKTWTCKFCGQIENNIIPFARHTLKHYSSRLCKACEVCKKTFNSKKSLNSHLKIVHKSYFVASHPKPSNNSESASKTRYKDVSPGGPMLNSMFTDSSDLQQTDFHQFNLDIDSQNLLLDNDNLNVENLLNENVKDLDHFNFEIDDNQKHFVCDICLKQFTKVKLLIVHLRHHTGDFMCYKCLKVFCRKENYKSHICNLNFLHSCTWCDRNFTQRKYLLRHLDAVHNKKFSCSKCNKSYYSNKELLEHNCGKVPASEKEKFACPVCDKDFCRNTYLKKHLRTHERTTKTPSSTAVVCTVCGLCLENKNSYYLHKKKHEQPSYSCTSCKKKFCRQDTLKQHLSCHQKLPKVACQICDKKFKTKKILRAHLTRHNDENSYNCSLCDARFKYRPNLNRHLKNNHKDKSSNVDVEYYNCPVCSKSIKLRSSLLRHLRKVHSHASTIDLSNMKPKVANSNQGKPGDEMSTFVNNNEENDKVAQNESLDNDLQNELDTQIRNLLNNAEANLTIHKQAVDRLVEELDINSKKEQKQGREICLSIPDFMENYQEITLDKDAYMLENGTIVQPQEDSNNVIIYVLDQPSYP